MSQKGLLERASGAYESVKNKYDEMARQKAIKAVNQKLADHNLKADELSSDDYEAMVSDELKDIKLGHSKTVAKGVLTILGLDLLVGF